MPIELVTTDGIFALDGGEWEVTNNIWLVGDDREVVVFDAAHDHRPIVDAVAGRRVRAIVLTHGHNDHINAAVPCATPSMRRSCCTPTIGCCGTWSGPTRPRPTARAQEPRSVWPGTTSRWSTRPDTPRAAAASTTSAGTVFTGDTLFCGGPGATGRSHSDEPTILRSIIDRLLTLPDHTVVHTGHGESTTIGDERAGVIARAAELGLG
jgi:glyoxylase-like metal-dependent hydrolase (beta-lactamase superfamily II)